MSDREQIREDRAYEKEVEDRKNSRRRIWLFFAAFLIWVAASTLPTMTQTVNIGENREGIECLILQTAEHRTNSRAAHQADSTHHEYEYTVGEMNIPLKVQDIDPDVCDKWLGTPDPTTTSSSGREPVEVPIFGD